MKRKSSNNNENKISETTNYLKSSSMYTNIYNSEYYK